MSRVLWPLFLCLAFLVGTGCGDKTKKPGSCKTEKDCKPGQQCDNNKCVDCTEDAHCGKGQRCSANACIAAPQCTKDDQCPSGQVCQAGKCKPCISNADCGPGGTCDAGACKRGTKCTKNEDCADDEDCIGGYCTKAGVGGNVGPGGCQLATVYFGFDQSAIEQSERDRLDQNYQCMEKSKGKNIVLVGHTDTSGTEEYNIALSERRAQAVADYLSRLGADPAKMQVVPKGETEPTGNGDDKDRRCEFQWR